MEQYLMLIDLGLIINIAIGIVVGGLILGIIKAPLYFMTAQTNKYVNYIAGILSRCFPRLSLFFKKYSL